ncbi:MAG: hypothetical protein LCH81_05685 [Bacteroidetes bacterium]|nr:hypothetical protein [Bacteroidota bacterium]
MENFKYYVRNGCKIENFKQALDIIKEEKIIIDSKYLEVMEAAEMGLCTAWLELSTGFQKGRKGLPVNYRMAKYYYDLMIKECTEDETYSKNPRLLFESYRAAGYFEFEFNNNQLAFNNLKAAVEIMLNQIPPEKWDFEIFHLLKQAATCMGE